MHTQISRQRQTANVRVSLKYGLDPVVEFEESGVSSTHPAPGSSCTLSYSIMPREEPKLSWLPSWASAWLRTFFQKTLDPSLPTPESRVAATRPSQRSILKHRPQKEYLADIAPKSVGDAPLPSFDPGIFDNELLKLKLYPKVNLNVPSLVQEPEGNIVEGTYMGTQVALTQAYSRIEQT